MHVVAGLATLVVFIVVALRASIRTALPSDLHVDTADDSVVPGVMQEKLREFEALGFRRLGPVRKVQLVRPAILVPMLSACGRAYAVVYRVLAGEQTRDVTDLVSVLDGGKRGLTTSMDIGGGCLDPAAGSFLQIFPKERPDALWHRHQRAQQFLAEHGLGVAPAPADQFDRILREAFARQRAMFDQASWRNTLTALGRVMFRRSPYSGPLAVQKRVLASLGSAKKPATSRDEVFARVDA